MYKMVRQGNASLQYTILPQKEDYYANEMSLVVEDLSEPSSTKAPSPTVKDKICSLCNRFQFILTEPGYLNFRVITYLIFCGAALYLIDQWVDVFCGRNRCQIGSPEETTESKIDKDYGTADSTDSKITTLSGEDFTSVFDDNRPSMDSIKTSTSGSIIHDDVSSNFEFTIDETTLSTTETPTTAFSSNTELPSTTFPSTLEVSSTTKKSPDNRSNVKSAPTVSIVNILKKLKMLKMPRVTLKLKTNDTIPQMYMKSGIASYKKGKITTSVLAQGLSLEGLIFKTPEGTIKPWREKWPFAEDSDMFRGLQDDMIWKELLLIIMIFLLGLSVILGLQMLLVVSRRQWNRIEEIDVEIQDDSCSSLLDVQCQDPIDKE